MEKRDLYDANFNLIGKTIEKNEEIPKNTYILIVAVFIQNDKDEFLIQKRSLNKDGKWATTGGHPKAGETSLEGILTEVKEELGITNEPTLFKRVHDDKYFCDLYYIKENVDISEVHLQTEEVSAVKWATTDEIEDLNKTGEFKRSHYLMFKDCLEYLKEKNA